MNPININEIDSAFYPDIYEGSFILLFHKLDFIFSEKIIINSLKKKRLEIDILKT
ncbi:MAG: hypothetical protein ACTSRP_08850 [Candidatus Helarchaeota archaeon]